MKLAAQRVENNLNNNAKVISILFKQKSLFLLVQEFYVSDSSDIIYFSLDKRLDVSNEPADKINDVKIGIKIVVNQRYHLVKLFLGFISANSL